MISSDEQSALDVIETSPAGTPYAKNAKTLAQGLRRREEECERYYKRIFEMTKELMDKKYRDGSIFGIPIDSYARFLDYIYANSPDGPEPIFKEIRELEAKLAPAEKVVQAARGFRDHGEAKNGTHANLLFEALAAYDEAVKKSKNQ